MPSKNMVSQEPLEITVLSELYVAGRKPEVGANGEFYALLTQHPDLFKRVVGFVDDETSTVAPRPSFTVTVNRDLSRDEALRGADIASHMFPYEFPFLGSGKEEVTIEIFRFWRNENEEQICQKLNKSGFRPIDVAELVALKAGAPDALNDGTGIIELRQLHNGFAVGINRRGKDYYSRALPTWGSIKAFYQVGAVKV